MPTPPGQGIDRPEGRGFGLLVRMKGGGGGAQRSDLRNVRAHSLCSWVKQSYFRFQFACSELG